MGGVQCLSVIGCKLHFDSGWGSVSIILVSVSVQLHCCGIQNASDWMTSPAWMANHTNTVPLSCCINQSNIASCDPKINSTDIYKDVGRLWKSLFFLGGLLVCGVMERQEV